MGFEVFLGCVPRTGGNKIGTKSGSFIWGTKFPTGEGRKQQQQVISLIPPCFRHFPWIAKWRAKDTTAPSGRANSCFLPADL